MLRLEYDIQHHLVLSRKDTRNHALIRMIVATLSTPEELANVSKRDFRRVSGKEFEYYTVKLFSSGKSRISPVDERTYELVMSLNEVRPFNFTKDEIDEIVAKYSPKDRKYTAEKLRNAVIKLLRDASLFEIDFERLSIEDMYAYMLDFNPLYSGLWELDDDEGAEEFILSYAELSGASVESIAKNLGESEERIRKILESGKKSLFSFRRQI